MNQRGLVLLLAGLAAVTIGACNDDGSGPAPTLKDIWPHADGSAWTFEVFQIWAWDDDIDLPTTLPSLEALHADLQLPAPGSEASADTHLFTFALDGMTTTSAGMPVQAVVLTLERTGTGQHGPFEPVGTGNSALLGGTAFAFQDSGFYRYSTSSSDRRWIYLEGDLRPGSEFFLPFQDVTPVRGLTGRVWSVGDRAIGGQRYADVVECMYRLDMGVTEFAGETSHNVLYGVMFYAPGTGPVAWHERTLFLGRTAYDPEGRPFCTDQHGVLVDAVLPAGN